MSVRTCAVPFDYTQGRLYGTNFFLPLLPGTSVPGFPMLPLRGWNAMIPSHSLPDMQFSTQSLMPFQKRGFIAALKALRHPKSGLRMEPCGIVF